MRRTAPILDGSDRETGWQETDGGIAVTLDAFPEATPPSEDERLRLELMLEGTARAPQIASAKVSVAGPDGPLPASGQNVGISLTTMEIEGDSLVLSGNVVATMVEGGSDELVIGGEGATTIDGNLQATVLRAD